MSEWKADLLTLTKNCDLEGVQNFLKERPTYDINTKDHRVSNDENLTIERSV